MAKRGNESPGKTARSVRLRPANPFDLIKVIAHSQSDPRKAIAELVQNSFDAGAAHVTITRWRRRGEVHLAILDDGRGVFPELPRPEALERIATNVGHSFKRNLSAVERQQEMLLGKYGIGILGFWCVGRELEMRTRVAASDVWGLLLVRDEPVARVAQVPARKVEHDSATWTEVAIRGVHPGAARQVTGRRLGDYLSSELRGQLLERPVKLRIVDRLARDPSLRDFLVVPRRYRGRQLDDFAELHVFGHSPARLELYYVDEDAERSQRAQVALTCGGTVVCDDLSQLEGYDFNREPWTLGCLDGCVEFPQLEVAPATRRGLVPGVASEALFEALRSLEPRLLQVIGVERAKRRSEEEDDVAQELRRVFRPLARALPQYDFFEIVRKKVGNGDSPADQGARVGHVAAANEPVPAPDAALASTESAEIIELGDAPEPDPDSDLEPQPIPPGPLDSARIVPRRSRLLPGASRMLTAKAFDVEGRRITEGVEITWSLRDGGGSLRAQGERARFEATESTGSSRIFVEAKQWKRSVEADAQVDVVDRLSGESPDAGIPNPERAFDPAGDWRSRVVGRRWQYNAAHPDYENVAAEPRRRFRYLVHLFAKEIVMRNYGEPKDERLLEHMVEVLTHVVERS